MSLTIFVDKDPYRVSGDVLVVLGRAPHHEQAVLPHPPGHPHVQGPAQQPCHGGGGEGGQRVGQRDAVADAAIGGLAAVARSEGSHGRDGRQAAGAARMEWSNRIRTINIADSRLNLSILKHSFKAKIGLHKLALKE